MLCSLISFDLFYQLYQAQAYPSRKVTRSDLQVPCEVPS